MGKAVDTHIWQQNFIKEHGRKPGNVELSQFLANWKPSGPYFPKTAPTTPPTSSGAVSGRLRQRTSPHRMADGGSVKWMSGAFSNKGALHRQLGVSEDSPIPQSKLTAAKNEARKQIEAANKAGRKAPASAVRTVRRVALAQRSKTGDISKMQDGGFVRPRDLISQGLQEG